MFVTHVTTVCVVAADVRGAGRAGVGRHDWLGVAGEGSLDQV